MRIVWAEQTKDDFSRFNEFLNPINPDAALRAIEAIHHQVQILIDHPEAGRPMKDGSERRELNIRFGKRGYVLRYIPEPEAGRVTVVRVWHSREDRTTD